MAALRAGASTDKSRNQYVKTLPVRSIFFKTSQIEPKRGPIDASHRKEFGGGLHSLIFFDLANDFARALIRKIT
jgi:hypothetical protein